MKINFLGDSITAGAGATTVENRYVSLVGEKLNCVANNFGVCGTRIAKQKTPSSEPIFDEDFYTRALTMDKDADFVFVFGGTNDYGHGDAPIGELEDKTQYTFAGAFNCLLNYLIETYGKSKLCYILPLPRYNQENLYGEGLKKEESFPLPKYIEYERIILEKNGVDFLELSNIFPVPSVNTGDELTMDGLHPNDIGHKIIAEKVVTYLKCKLKID